MKAVRKRIIIKNRKPLGEYYRAATLLQVNMDAENKISDDPAYIPINLAKKAGMLILENGGETFRAEETVMRICRTAGYTASETIALPTGLFITLSRGSEAERQIGCRCADTVVGRVKKRTVDLSRLEQTNAVARLYTGGEISAEEAYRRLCELERERAVNKYLTAAVAAASTLFFTVLYGGNLFDCLTAAFCGFLVQLLSSSIKRPDIYRFAISLLGGIVIAAIAVGATAIAGTGSIDKIIVGAIIPLLPGLAMTNAIRDTIMGDLVSGIARLAEVMLTAVSLAGGVGVVLSLYVYLGGAI